MLTQLFSASMLGVHACRCARVHACMRASVHACMYMHTYVLACNYAHVHVRRKEAVHFVISTVIVGKGVVLRLQVLSTVPKWMHLLPSGNLHHRVKLV